MKCPYCENETPELVGEFGECAACYGRRKEREDYYRQERERLSESLRSYGDHGWAWNYDGDEWRTNSIGEGKFRRRRDYTWQQIAGTSQFSLPAEREQALGVLRAHYR